MFTNDDKLAENLRQMANHGQTIRYHHDNIGVNSRLDSLQAAILRIKLRHLHQYTSARQKTAQFYDEAFNEIPELEIPSRDAKSSHVFHQYTLKTNGLDRNKMQEFLKEKRVPSMIYYPIPVHKQKAYANERFEQTDFSTTNDLCDRVISLPMQTELDNTQLNHIVHSVIEYIKK